MDAGLCDRCEHQRIITSGKGSRFSLCQRSFSDPRFRRYPPLPVLRCEGYEPRGEATAGTPPPGPRGEGGGSGSS